MTQRALPYPVRTENAMVEEMSHVLGDGQRPNGDHHNVKRDGERVVLGSLPTSPYGRQSSILDETIVVVQHPFDIELGSR